MLTTARNTYIIWNEGGLVHECPRYELLSRYGRHPDDADYEIRNDGVAWGEWNIPLVKAPDAVVKVAILDRYPDTEEVIALLNDIWPAEDE